MLQMYSIFLKKYIENKGDVKEINTIAFTDTGVTKKKIDKISQMSKITYELMRHLICQFHKEYINVKK